MRPARLPTGACVRLSDLMQITRGIHFMFFCSKDVFLKKDVARDSREMFFKSWCSKTMRVKMACVYS